MKGRVAFTEGPIPLPLCTSFAGAPLPASFACLLRPTLDASCSPSAPRRPPPLSHDAPTCCPADEWRRAQKTFRVVYARVFVRERPHLRSKTLEVLNKGR